MNDKHHHESAEMAETELKRDEAIRMINQYIAVHGIFKEELTFPRKNRKAVDKGVIRYRDPHYGMTWTGYGRAPAWFKAIPNAKEVCKV